MCTSFRFQSSDGTIIVGRSLEFDAELNPYWSHLHAGQQYSSEAPGSQAGLSWTATYNALVVGALGQTWYFDGMNDQGLVVEGLWLPNYTQYQDEQATNNPKQALTNLDFITWCLTNFTTVAEIVEALQNTPVWVWGPALKVLNGEIAPLHYALHDPTGGCMVIEYVNGVLMTYENPLGILTNAPPFEWQQINLSNYLNLQAVTPPSKLFGSMKLTPPGVGGGFLGIPGDWTPPSRFVRVANMCQCAQPASDAASGVNLAEHLLNAVDIPKGDIVTSSSPTKVEYTQFACIWDLTHCLGYYRSYDDLTLKMIDVNQLKQRQTSQPACLPFNRQEHTSIDMTPSLLR